MMKPSHSNLIYDISEISGLFSDAVSLDAFLQNVVELIAGHMQSDVCSVYLYDEDSRQLVLKATRGLLPEAVGKIRLQWGEGLTGRALKELRTICVRDASRHKGYRYFPGIGEEKYESFLAVPIVRGQKRIGVVVIQNAKKNYFEEEDARVLKAITSQLANTIETTQLIMSLDRRPPAAPRQEAARVDLKLVKGRAGSPGYARGPAKIFVQNPLEDLSFGTDRSYTPDDLTLAVRRTEEYFEGLQKKGGAALSDVASLIFTAQILMLKDQAFIDDILQTFQLSRNLPQAIIDTVKKYSLMFERLPDAYLREKKQDVIEAGRALLQNLVGFGEEQGHVAGRIIIAEEVFLTDILKLSIRGAAGIILLSGGITSHLSILARSLSLPLIISDCPALVHIAPETPMLMDATQGNIYIDPDADVVVSFEKKETQRRKVERQKAKVKARTLTADGREIKLMANINLLNDITAARQVKAKGVGLYRTEFPFLIRTDFPSEEEQVLVYRKIVEGFPGQELNFRTLDIGGDKVLSYYDHPAEANPFLGMRSIRFSLQHRDIFAQQLRAILRAGAGADLKIMFPMISSLDEFRAAKAEVLHCIGQLKEEETECHESPKIGMMVELPAVLPIIDSLARESDFFSIGTNDFIQYMLAVDRTNEKVADLYLPHHPAILRGFQMIVEAAERHRKEVTICGDMAHDKRYLPYLLGIGIRSLSLAPAYFFEIQVAISSINLASASAETRRLLDQDLIETIEKSISSNHFPA